MKIDMDTSLPHLNLPRTQILWWGWPWMVKAGRPKRDSSMRGVYSWWLHLGPIEVRRWAAPPAPPEENTP